MTSPVWELKDSILRCYLTLIGLSDKRGYVFCTPEALARVAHVTPDEGYEAISVLEERGYITPFIDGWRIVEFEKVYTLLRADEIVEKKKISQAQKRYNEKETKTL